MTIRSNKIKWWLGLLLVAFLSVPLLGWNALPNSATHVEASGNARPRPVSERASAAGDEDRGRDLFMGTLHFENSGPPCMGCHNVGNNGLLGGGALGPDLTNVATRRSQSELEAILSNSDSVSAPVMQPIYAEHLLTEVEQADLLAFLQASPGQPETNREWLVIGISLIGFLGAVGLIELVYHRRLRGVRKPLVRQAHTK